MGSFYHRLVRKVTGQSKRRSRRHAAAWTLRESGVELVVAHGRTEHIPWSSVHEIVAFRANRIRTSEIYLEFRFGAEFTLLEESNPQFEAIRVEIERRFGIAPEWFDRLAQPPLEQQASILWKRRSPVELRKAL